MSFLTIQQPNGSKRPVTMDDYVKASSATKVAVGVILSGTALLVLGVSNPFAALAVVAGGQGLAWLPDMAKKCVGSVRSTLRSFVQVENADPAYRIVDATDANGNLDPRKRKAHHPQQPDNRAGNASAEHVRRRPLNDGATPVSLLNDPNPPPAFNPAYNRPPAFNPAHNPPPYNLSGYQGSMSDREALDLALARSREEHHRHSQYS